MQCPWCKLLPSLQISLYLLLFFKSVNRPALDLASFTAPLHLCKCAPEGPGSEGQPRNLFLIDFFFFFKNGLDLQRN